MVRKILVAVVTVAVAAVFATSFSIAQETDKDSGGGEQPDFMEAISPGAHHKQLKLLVGDWDVKVMMWEAPGQDPAISTGKAKGEMILGGRFVMTRLEGSVFGMPFEGLGMVGYDKGSGKHVSFWVDNMGTQMLHTEGDCSNHCLDETHLATVADPSGTDMHVKIKTKIIDKDKHTYEWYILSDDGSEFKSMEIVYSRS